jgi:hypothetical protein
MVSCMRLRGTVAFLLLASCASGWFGRTRKQWDSRVGSFTYTQAIEEIGAPDEKIVTSSGGWVAIWRGHQDRAAALSSLDSADISLAQRNIVGSNGTRLRLTFTLEGTLLAWGNL